MPLEVRRARLEEIGPLRQRQRAEATCQIVRDSILPRGLADPYLVSYQGTPIGFGGVWREHFPERLMDFFIEEWARRVEFDALRALLSVSGATSMESQSNRPRQFRLLYAVATSVLDEHLLFEDGPEQAPPTNPGVSFGPRPPYAEGPEGDWVVQREGRVIGGGGYLTHYNPPYGDLYLEIIQDARGQGVGSYLVWELRRVCRAAGFVPAARCDPGNEGSRRALENGGLVRCGVLCAGPVDPSAALLHGSELRTDSPSPSGDQAAL